MTENEAKLLDKLDELANDTEVDMYSVANLNFFFEESANTIRKLIEEIKAYRAIGTVEDFKELKEYKEKMEMQYLDDMDNPLEPLKLSSALQSEIFKYNYRKENKPQDINILDYTVMYALKHCLEEQINTN